MAIYLYDDGGGLKILTEGNAIAVHEDCCCGGADCWVLRPCSQLSECYENAEPGPPAAACEPPMPMTLYITISGLAGHPEIEAYNGLHVFQMGTPTDCTWSDIDGGIIGYNAFNDRWELMTPMTILFGGCIAQFIKADATGCTPEGGYTFNGAGCMEDDCPGMCAASAGATAVVSYTDPGMTIGPADLVVTDDMSSAGPVIKYNDVCYAILGTVPCAGHSTITLNGNYSNWSSCEACETTACYLLRECADLSTCNSCSPALGELVTVTFSGLVGSDFSPFNGSHGLAHNPDVPFNDCNYGVDHAGSEVGVAVDWDGSGWFAVIKISTTCIMYFNGPQDTGNGEECNPNGSYTYASCLGTGCPGDGCAGNSGATATVVIGGASVDYGGGATNDIIVNDDLSTYSPGAVIGYNNTCYYFLGEIACPGTPTTMGTWDDFTSCDDCAVPCSCPGTFTSDLRIQGYTDGDIVMSGCTSCISGGSTAWTGGIPYVSGCDWYDFSLTEDQIDSKAFGGVEIILVTSGSPVCYWELKVYCEDSLPSQYDAWVGRKYVGSTPEGIYTKVSGCSTGPSSLVVEAVP